MADLKKLALGRKGIQKGTGKTPPPSKPETTLEDSCREEIGEAEESFRERMKQEDKRKRQATDTEFWFAVYFPDREAKYAFLRKFGLDKIGNKYLPGGAVARVFARQGLKGKARNKE